MTSDEMMSGGPDELELLRREARALGMPGEITPASVGITLRSPEQILGRTTTGTDAASAGAPGAVLSRSRSRSRRRLIVRIGAVAAATAAVAGVIFAPWQQNHALAEVPPILEYQFADLHTIADAPGEDARAVLLELSDRAKAQREEVASGTTQYHLFESWYSVLEDGKPSELVPSRRDQWLRADGSMRIREAHGQPLDLDGRGLSITEKAKPAIIANETYPAEESDRDTQFVAKLSGDYREVRAALIDVAGCEDKYVTAPVGECLYRQISSSFRTYVVPPRVAAAYWRILADDPSLRSLGTVKDRAGRPGIGISLITEDFPQFRDILIISTETGQLLGTEQILIKDVPDITFKAPALMSFDAILQSQFTTKDGPSD